ncbi:hypothetical protein [Pedobacter hartonius]|uniref:Uncharacterized protein n=1 Tax=Pedobacter hartonius TaxID=425514 RepID=A0A1H3YGI5_9SPHI|nr:hypothetical protein [Pedobacter hartonius]SEA10699.1 hypothetical protein SAMN05443550_10211 [Pedobacter hartonius]
MKKFTFSLKICTYLLLCLIFLSFSAYGPTEEDAGYMQQKLTDHYDPESGPKNVRKYELNVTDKGFCRYKRFFSNGKVEYFSCNLTKFKEIDYLGNTLSGTLFVRTKGADVIVQTYNDKRGGDIDSMAAFMAIPLKNLEAEDLIDLSEKFQAMSLKLHQ